jgi:aldehyde:ferredoxin oxidoreductase
VEVKDGPFKADPRFGGPEYESVAALGSNCGISDLKAVAAANHVCNAMGMDTIGCGMMVSFAMDCYENGVISKEQTGGLELKFGNAEAMVRTVELIAAREGFGDLLARGYKACIEAWGADAAQYALHVKWQPLPMHEPRAKWALGLGYAVSPTGADHVHNIHDSMVANEDGLPKLHPFGIHSPMSPYELGLPKVRIFYYLMHHELLKNMLGVCVFLPYTVNMIVEIVQAITGWDTSLLELFKAGERGMAMARAFNAREGFTAADDTVPDRLFEAFESGPLKDTPPNREAFESALQDFYAMAGWDAKSAAPTRVKLGELGLDWVADELADVTGK